MKYNKRQALEACSNVETVHVDPSLNTASSFHINEEDVVTEPTEYTAPIYVAETHAAFLGLRQIFKHAIDHKFNKHTTYQLHTDSCIVYFMLNRGKCKSRYISTLIFLFIFLYFSLN